jgi:hypothetical protein
VRASLGVPSASGASPHAAHWFRTGTSTSVEERSIPEDAWVRRPRTRKAVSLLLLAVGWVSIVATSRSVNDRLATTLKVPGAALGDGDVELIVAENDAAASDQEPAQPLKVDVSASMPQVDADPEVAASASLTLVTGEELRMRRGPPRDDGLAGFVISWMPDPCAAACIHTATLSVNTRPLSPLTTWDVTASIVYRSGENSTPKDSGLVVGLRRDGSSDLLTSNTAAGLLPSGVLLTPAEPEAHQTLEMEVPRSAIPVQQGDTAELVWKGGALRTLPASAEAKALVIVTPQGLGPVTVPVDGTGGIVSGTSHVGFEVPLVLVCDASRCVADLQADFELQEGSWLVLDWSNDVSGVRTMEGDVWIAGWHLREAPS